MSKHLATTTIEATYSDLVHGIDENFTYCDRNGKHRVVEAFNPMTGITTRINDKAAA